MDKPGGNEAGKVLKKGKKKHAKDELDRQKQAEKKRRRLEKALANSAAIISALEKKRQQKKEEQERQDEEGAAIAEAVALHVLIGDDSDDHLILNKHRRCNRWDDVVGLEITPVLQGVDSYSSSGLTYAAHAHVPQWRWTDGGISGPFSSRGHIMDYQAPCHQGTFPRSDGFPGFIAAQAVSSLQIGDHSSEDTFPQSDGCPGFIAAQAVSSLQIGVHSYEDAFPRSDGCPGYAAAHAVSSLQIEGHSSEDIFPIQDGGRTAVLHRILNSTNNRLNLYKEL